MRSEVPPNERLLQSRQRRRLIPTCLSVKPLRVNGHLPLPPSEKETDPGYPASTVTSVVTEFAMKHSA